MFQYKLHRSLLLTGRNTVHILLNVLVLVCCKNVDNVQKLTRPCLL